MFSQRQQKTPIAEIDDAKLVENLSLLFKRIAIDVGYIIPQNENDWNYIQSRLLDILKRYYSDMTLADIKIAFELATTGELDEFFPKDKYGNPDKKPLSTVQRRLLCKDSESIQAKADRCNCQSIQSYTGKKQ